MRTTRSVDLFSRAGMNAVADKMDGLAKRTEGNAWVTIEPDVDNRQVPTGSALWKVFSGRGPVIPSASWVPVLGERQDTHFHEFGISHGTGGGAIERLERNGVQLPDNWRIAQDHKKRGIVLGIPPSDPASVAVDFAMRAITLLAPFAFSDAFAATFSEA